MCAAPALGRLLAQQVRDGINAVALEASFRYQRCIDLRWGNPATWTQPRTDEDWLWEAVDRADPTSRPSGVAPSPEFFMSEARTAAPRDIFDSDLDLSELAVQEQTPPPSPASEHVSVASCVSQEADASSAVAADVAIPARLEEVSAAEDLFQELYSGQTRANCAWPLLSKSWCSQRLCRRQNL